MARNTTPVVVNKASASSFTPVRVQNPVTFVAMSARTLSPDEAERVIAGIRLLIERCGSQVAVHQRHGISQQTISKVLKGEGHPGLRLAEQVARALGVSPTELRTGRGETPSLGSMQGWDDAERLARRRFAHIPEQVWSDIRGLQTAHPPDHISPEFVLQLALAWSTGLARAPHAAEKLEEEIGSKK